MYGLVTTVGPVAEPLDLDAAKAHLRVDHTADDGLIGRMIVAARELAESHTARRFVGQTLVLTLPGWPWDVGAWHTALGLSALAGRNLAWWLGQADAIPLPVEPVSEVVAVRYYGTDGVQHTASVQTWLSHSPPLVAPAPGQAWPGLQSGRLAPIEVEFTAGYGEAGDVPASVAQAMLVTLGYWYENRGDGKDPASLGLPPGAVRLLDSVDAKGYR